MGRLVNENDFRIRCEQVLIVKTMIQFFYTGTVNANIKDGLQDEFMEAGLIDNNIDLTMVPGAEFI